MRLLRIIASMDPVKGGPCQGIRNSIPELEKLGVHNEVACLDSPNALFLKKDSFTIHPLGPGKTPWCYSSKLIPWLMKNLNRFDAVIVHGLWLYPGYAVRKSVKMLAKRQRGLNKEDSRIPRIFIMPHGMLDPYFQQASERKLKAIRNWIYWKFIEGRVVNDASGLLFTCEGELELAREPFQPYRPLKEVNVGYGIADPPVYSAQMRKTFLEICPEVEESPYILFLSRIHEKKGVDLLIRAYLNIVSEAINGMSVYRSKHASGETSSSNGCIRVPKLVIAGPGIETKYGQRMLRLAHQNKFPEHFILFPGMLTGDAKWGAYYGCEAFILPSHQENFGIAVVEAMGCGKPVLISNQINIWKEIQEGGAGIVSDDVLSDIQNKLKTWCNMTSVEKFEMGRRARSCYEKKFFIEPVVSRLLKAIEC